jgi:DNA-binding response OmpR family regulator
MDYDIEMAENGEEALKKIKTRDFNLVLLDLRLPGMDGMELLRRIHDFRPDVRVVILSAHGTIDSAVEAMKLGAVDFLEKPFIPGEIRDLVHRALDGATLDKARESNYKAAIGLARKCIGENHLDAAMEHLRRATYLDPSHAEAINLMGAVMELKNERAEARRYYLAAYSLDPTFQPATKNLERITSWHRSQAIDLGEEAHAKTKKK